MKLEWAREKLIKVSISVIRKGARLSCEYEIDHNSPCNLQVIKGLMKKTEKDGRVSTVMK